MADSGVRTLFIGGLPGDCTERELHLLFYTEGPVEAIKLQQTPQGSFTAFVQMPDRERAERAQQFAHGMQYDPSVPGMTLRVEFAKQDFRKAPGSGVVQTQPQPRVQYVQPVPQVQRVVPHVQQAVVVAPFKRPTWGSSGPAAGATSSTLFLGGLGAAATFAEVQEYCGAQDGFVKLAMKDEGGPKAVGWAEFKTPALASKALSRLRNVPLPSSNVVPNLEFARSESGGAPQPEWASFVPAAVWSPPGLPVAARPVAASTTLFIGGLGAAVSEEEIQEMAASQEGCVNVSVKDIGTPRAVAWVQFETPALAKAARTALKETPLQSLGHPANVEFARGESRRPAP